MTDASMSPLQAVSAATSQRDETTSALSKWYSQECEQLNGGTPELKEKFLRRLRTINANYEEAVEPYRQNFLNDYPGQPLPPFLMPGFGAHPAVTAEKLLSRQATTNTPAKSGTLRRLAIAFGVASALVAGVLIIDSASQNSVDSTARASANKIANEKAIENILGPNARQAADGFKHVGDGVLFRWATTDEKNQAEPNCISGLSCFVVAIEMNGDCPSGLYIELTLKDKSGNTVGMTNEKTPGMSKGDRGIFAITGATKAPKAALGKISCY